jgi:hypothetical protein
MKVDCRELHFQPIGIGEVYAVAAGRAPWLQSLPLQLLHHGIGIEVLNGDAEMVQPRLLVPEKRQEVLAEPQEAVILGLVKERNPELFLVEIAGSAGCW